MRQSSKAPTWKLHSSASVNLRALARAVREALAKRRLYLESKHVHSWVCGGGSATGTHRGYLVSSIPPSTRPSPAGWWVVSGHPPPQVLWCKPYVYSWVHIHSSHPVGSVHVLISPLSPCPSRTMSNTIHDLAICSLSTRGRELLWLKPWAHDQFSSEGIPDPGASQPHAMASAVSRDRRNLKCV